MPGVTRSNKEEWENLPSPLRQRKSPAHKKPQKGSKKTKKQASSPPTAHKTKATTPPTPHTRPARRKDKRSPKSPKQPPKSVLFKDQDHHRLAKSLGKLCEWIDDQDRRRKRKKRQKRKFTWWDTSSTGGRDRHLVRLRQLDGLFERGSISPQKLRDRGYIKMIGHTCFWSATPWMSLKSATAMIVSKRTSISLVWQI